MVRGLIRGGLKIKIMKKVLFYLFIMFSVTMSAQATFKTDSIEVFDGDSVTKRMACKTTFMHFNGRYFNLDCENRDVYSFLLPHTEFRNLSVLTFMDTGYMISKYNNTPSLSDTTNLSDSTTQTLGVMYQSMNVDAQLVQFATPNGITLLKRNQMYIRFY